MKSKIVYSLVPFLFLAACGKETGSNDNKPSLADLKSPQAVVKAAETTMEKGDSSKPLSEYKEITSGNDLMFLYYALLSLPVDYEKIASIYSQDYNSTSDSFKKQDIINSLKARVDSQISAAKSSRYVIYTYAEDYKSALNSYDFQSKSFKLNGLDANSSYYWNDNASRYKIRFMNAEQVSTLQVADEKKAREIEALVSKKTPMLVKIYAFVQDADPSSTTVKAEVMKVEVKTMKGEVIYP